jgi:hypothetical protein
MQGRQTRLFEADPVKPPFWLRSLKISVYGAIPLLQWIFVTKQDGFQDL